MRKILIFSMLLAPAVLYAAVGLFNATPPTINWKKNDIQQITLTNNSALSFKHAKVGGEYKLVVKQDATGGRAITWPTDVLWPGGSAPTLTSTPNATDVMEFLFDGVNYLGSYNLNYTDAPAPVTLNNGLVHYWRLDESSGNVSDAVGTLHLTNENYTPFIAGLLNNGGDFEKNLLQDFVTTTDLTNSPLTAYSISAWIKPESIPNSGDQTLIFISAYDFANIQLRYYNSSGTPGLLFKTYDSTTEFNIASSGALNNGQWYLLTGTWDGNTIRLYVNGIEVGNQSGITTMENAGVIDQTRIGGSLGNSNTFDGMIDEVGFWNRALSASEISQLYNGGIGRSYPF